MNFNQIINMLMRMVTGRLLNWGIRRMSSLKPGQKRTAQEQGQDKAAKETAKRARQAARLTRRMK